jgi:hypothetical protein
MAVLAADPGASSWTRALVADRIADVDPAAGHQALRQVAQHADEVVRSWIADTLQERGAVVDPKLRTPLVADAVPVRKRPLGTLARHALTQRIVDARATEYERTAAARQLAQSGDLNALRAMTETAGIDPLDRVRLASALADAGDTSVLRDLAAGSAGRPSVVYAAALVLFERGDPMADAALRGVVDNYPTAPAAFAAAAVVLTSAPESR